MRWTERQLADHQVRGGDGAVLARAPARTAGKSSRRVSFEMGEAEIHQAVVEHLRARCRQGIHWHHSPGGEYRHPATAARLQRMGVRPGVPDLLFLIDGRLHGLELKRERGGRLSANQRAMHAELVAAGATVETARGLDQALAILTVWGVLDPFNER